MPLSRYKAAGLGLLFAVALSVPALAQPSGYPTGQPYPTCTKPVSTQDSEAAHNKYTAGKVDYDEGNNDKALSRFNEAYKLDCTKHELLIIISAAWDKKGEKAEAARALETFLERAQNVAEADRLTYQKKIERLKEDAKAKAAATPPPTATATTPPSGGGEEGGHTVYPWLVAGAGVVALAVGIVLVATAPSLPPGCVKKGDPLKDANGNTLKDPQTGQDQIAASDTCKRVDTDPQVPDPQNEPLAQRQKDAGRSQEQPVYGAVVAAIGGALIVGGVLWHFLEPTGEKTTGKTRVVPAVTPSYGGLFLTHTF